MVVKFASNGNPPTGSITSPLLGEKDTSQTGLEEYVLKND